MPGSVTVVPGWVTVVPGSVTVVPGWVTIVPGCVTVVTTSCGRVTMVVTGDSVMVTVSTIGFVGDGGVDSSLGFGFGSCSRPGCGTGIRRWKDLRGTMLKSYSSGTSTVTYSPGLTVCAILAWLGCLIR